MDMEITLERFNEVIEGLEKGEIRVAEKIDGQWVVNIWVKEVILAGFKLGAITEMEYEYRCQDPLPLFDPYQTMPEDEQKVFVGIINELGAVVEDGAYSQDAHAHMRYV